MNDSTKDTIAISAGLGCLGLSTGAIAGATVTAGAAQALITGVLTFVGGAVLSYSAFATRQQAQKKVAAAKKEAAKKEGPAEKKEGEAEPGPANVTRIGLGLAALSLALAVGGVIGLWFRYTDPFGLAPPTAPAAPAKVAADPKEEGGETPPPSKGASFGFQAGPGDAGATVKRARSRMRNQYYGPETSQIYQDVAELADLASRCPPPP